MRPGFLKQVLRLLIASWSKTLNYRADIVAYTLVSVAAPIVALAVWYTVAQSGGLGGNPQTVLTYYIAVMLVEIVTRAWRGLYIVDQIRTGAIVEQLIRPPVILLENVTSNIVTKAVQLFFPVIIFLAALLIFPHSFAPAIYELKNVILFLVSLMLATTIWFFLDIAIGLTAFWFEEAFELHTYRFLLMQIASGILIPFSAMPEIVRSFFSVLPFRYVISAPVEILLNQPVHASIGHLLVVQVGWVILTIFAVRILFVRGLRHYAVPGQ